MEMMVAHESSFETSETALPAAEVIVGSWKYKTIFIPNPREAICQQRLTRRFNAYLAI